MLCHRYWALWRENPDLLLYPQDPKREPRSFTLTLARQMGQKRGKAEGFVRETRVQTFAFYRDLVQQLKVWTAKAPKLREGAPEAAPVMPVSDPPPAGSPDREPGEAPDPWARPAYSLLPSGSDD